MKKIGFNKSTEYLPAFDKFQTEVNQRIMFLKFFNQEVSCDLRFTKKELYTCRKNTLFKVFAMKVYKQLGFTQNYSKAFTFDLQTSLKINSFEKKVKSELGLKLKNRFLLNTLDSNIKTALKLIDIFEESGCSLYLDGNKIFKNFVSNKIIRNNESKKIDINFDSIDITSEEHSFKTKIFTFWEFISSKNLQIEKHIKKAVDCINSTDFKQIYLVYPKNENFNKHMRIRTQGIACGEYEIKLIPYSLRSTLR